MQQPFIFIDRGNGWESLYSHLADVTALAGFTIRWGVDSLGDQPDPSVLILTLHDKTGELAGNVRSLAGARILIQISAQPTFNDLANVDGIIAGTHVTLDNFHTLYVPPEPSTVSATAITIFDGVLTTGGSVDKIQDTWNIKVTASSRMILWKRLASQGPVSNDSHYEGLHWVGTAAQRLAELKKRAQLAGAPAVDTTGVTLPSAVAPYATDSFPTALELLHRLYASDVNMPLWSEYPSGATSVIKATSTTRSIAFAMSHEGRMSLLDYGKATDPLEASRVRIDDTTLTIPDPITQIVVKTKHLKRDESKISVEDVEVDFTSSTIPANLTAVQKSLTVESDVVSWDETNGYANGRAWTPTASERSTRSYVVSQLNSRLHPESLIFDSRYLDPATHADLYTCAPSNPHVIFGSIYKELTTSDGYPLAIAPFIIIGGTISFSWKHGKPVLEHTATPLNLPRYPLSPTIGDFEKNITSSFADMDTSLSVLSMVNQFI